MLRRLASKRVTWVMLVSPSGQAVGRHQFGKLGNLPPRFVGTSFLTCAPWQAGNLPPQADGGLRGEAVYGHFAALEADLEGVGQQPSRILLAIAVREKMDALVGRADPATLFLGQVGAIGPVHQDVRAREEVA